MLLLLLLFCVFENGRRLHTLITLILYNQFPCQILKTCIALPLTQEQRCHDPD